MDYLDTVLAIYVDRPNRFVAQVRLNHQIIVAHVKNTGRTNILIAGRTVALVPATNNKRKTCFDLIAVRTEKGWINIDSQAPNIVVKEGLQNNSIALPGINQVIRVHPEMQYQDVRFDFFGEGDQQQLFFLEVKGVTLSQQNVAAFPDSPSQRGEKHVRKLISAKQDGYHAFLLFLIQVPDIQIVTINRAIQPTLAETIKIAQNAGVHVLAYGTHVKPGRMTLGQPIPFNLAQPFNFALALEEAATQK
ncbi:MAG: DNA/RNA nuclease SfsA [Schleiferilactobacillus harbinensis]|jgi:sugar fermentation stimulation protein A|nr:DNA/RNA nuclease SfsA [Schleiferilactobacillus harbinensis]MCI1911555.1 DNA/RNA nuclease SfsA [Schleiferilactobacillus harbinensis]